MAITDRYVTQGAGGGGAGTSGSPWTFAEAITNAVAGDRINVQSDASYSIGTTTFGAGIFAAPIIWRGYDSTIGDCDNLGRNADGTLNTTGMPAITVTGIWTLANYVTLQSLNITGALSSQLLGDTAVDAWNIISCSVTNTQNHVNAAAVAMDDTHVILNCDMACTGATHGKVLEMDLYCQTIGCRFTITAAQNCIETRAAGVIIDCVFIKLGSQGGDGIEYETAINVSGSFPTVSGCTFVNLTSAVYYYGTHTGGAILLNRCHLTGCVQAILNTTNIAAFLTNCRTRDNTSPPSTVELITVGAITADTGGDETDYNNAGSGDYRLITAAPGYNAGWNGGDIGGLQTDPPASSGGGMIGGGNLNGGFQ